MSDEAGSVDHLLDLPLVVHGYDDWKGYFAGADLKGLRKVQEEEMHRIGGNWQSVADRIHQIVQYCDIAALRMIFSPVQIPRDLYDPLVQTSEGKIIGSELQKRNTSIQPQYLSHYITMEFIHTADPDLRLLRDNIAGKKLFSLIPNDLVLRGNDRPAVGLYQAETQLRGDACLIQDCPIIWRSGYSLVSETGRMWYVNEGVLHFIQDHHLFETSPHREPYSQNIDEGRNAAAISPTDFYIHFMGDSPVS